MSVVPSRPRAGAALAFVTLLCVCGGPSDTVMVERSVVVDGSGAREVTNDLGWAVRVDVLRVVLEDLELTGGGDQHASLLAPVRDVLLPLARAHPGHDASGEVLGELSGRFVIDFAAPGRATLGAATLLLGSYAGANFTFTRAAGGDVPDDDPLFGHTLWIEGQASKDGVTVPFVSAVDQDEGRRLVGAPFAYEATEGEDRAIVLSLLLVEPREGTTLFDGVDFAALPEDGSAPAGHALNTRLRDASQSHDFWSLHAGGEHE